MIETEGHEEEEEEDEEDEGLATIAEGDEGEDEGLSGTVTEEGSGTQESESSLSGADLDADVRNCLVSNRVKIIFVKFLVRSTRFYFIVKPKGMVKNKNKFGCFRHALNKVGEQLDYSIKFCKFKKFV